MIQSVEPKKYDIINYPICICPCGKKLWTERGAKMHHTRMHKKPKDESQIDWVGGFANE